MQPAETASLANLGHQLWRLGPRCSRRRGNNLSVISSDPLAYGAYERFGPASLPDTHLRSAHSICFYIC
jgi:hypothetical protein